MNKPGEKQFKTIISIIQITYPLVNCYITVEAMAVEIIDLPINSMVIFQFVM